MQTDLNAFLNLAQKKIHGKGMAIDAEGEEVPLEIIFQCFEWVWNNQQNKTPVECIGYRYIFGVPHVHGWFFLVWTFGMDPLVLTFLSSNLVDPSNVLHEDNLERRMPAQSCRNHRQGKAIKTSGLGKARWRSSVSLLKQMIVDYQWYLGFDKIYDNQ